jgi:hypothetical protein
MGPTRGAKQLGQFVLCTHEKAAHMELAAQMILNLLAIRNQTTF